MQVRYRSVFPLVAVCLALAVAPALAAKPKPTSLRPQSQSVPAGVSHSTSGVCQLGAPGPAAISFAYLLPPDDEYYQLINPADCPGCGGAGVLLQYAHILLRFDAACQIPVTVSVMPAMEVAPGCLAPNPFGVPVCAPAQYVVSDGGNLDDCQDFSFPMPAGCYAPGPVFLEIRFDLGTCPNSRPKVCGPDHCNNCTQFNFFPGAVSPGEDLCAILTPFGVYGISMWADAACVGATPTLPGSWGKMKTLYR